MSWSVTFNQLQDFHDNTLEALNALSNEQREYIHSHNPLYLSDLESAIIVALDLHLASATLSGGRTPSPVGSDEVVTVSIVGLTEGRDFNKEMARIVVAPDNGS
jgi:hypothetical protein